MKTQRGSYKKEENRIKWFHYFSLRCVFCSKIETGLSSGDEGDVEIDAYLEKLLSSFTDPRGFDLKQSEKQFSEYDSGAFRKMAQAERGRVKYQIYRTKNDFLLLSFTVVDDYSIDKYFFREKASIRGKGDYCLFSYTFSHTVSKGDFLIADILEKLFLALEKYSKLISHFRCDHSNLFQRLARGKFYQLERVVNGAGQREALEEKQNQLLDLYSQWRKNKSSKVEEEIQTLIEEIKDLKPEFGFSLPEK